MSNSQNTNYEISLYNDTSDLLDASIDRSFGQNALFDTTKDLFLTISKFTINITKHEIVKISSANQSKYSIQMQMNIPTDSSSATDAGQTNTEYLDLSTDYPIFSPTDYVESVNRCLLKCYSNLLKKYTASSGVFYNSSAATQTFSSGTTTQTFSKSLSGSKTAFVKLTLLMNSTTNTTNVNACNIYLTNPAGQNNLVARNVVLTANQTYQFADCAISNQGNLSFNTLDKNYTDSNNNLFQAYYQPIESFQSYRETTGNGSWVLTIVPSGNNIFNGNITSTLEIVNSPSESNYTMSSHIPYITLNKDTGYFSWVLHEKHLQTGLQIKLGGNINNVLNIRKYSANQYLEFPITSLTNGLDAILTFGQNSPGLGLLSEIDKIVISTNSLNISKDLLNNNLTSSAISSFTIDNSNPYLSGDYIEYVYSGDRPLRCYKFKSDSNITSINLQFYIQRRDETLELIQIPTHTNLSCVLSFIYRH